MPIFYIKNWENIDYDDIIDVRSPSEYNEDHIPTSINLPVLNNIQRKLVGTTYKKENPFYAKKLGAALISKNISEHINKKLLVKPGGWKPIIYCWRGGQRSKAFATILSEIGWRVYVLKGGYKTYRSIIIKKVRIVSKKKKFIVIQGPTGCAKTKILHCLNNIGINILDLEGLAQHKGSLLGRMHNKNQPSQKFFESLIYFELKKLNENKIIFIESESSKIGNLYLPSAILKKIQTSPVVEITASIETRIKFLLKDYKDYINKNNSFLKLFSHARNKVGNKTVKEWRQSYNNKNWKDLAYMLVTQYYDLLYAHKLKSKKNKLLKSYNLKSLTSKSIKYFCEKLKNDLKIY